MSRVEKIEELIKAFDSPKRAAIAIDDYIESLLPAKPFINNNFKNKVVNKSEPILRDNEFMNLPESY